MPPASVIRCAGVNRPREKVACVNLQYKSLVEALNLNYETGNLKHGRQNKKKFLKHQR